MLVSKKELSKLEQQVLKLYLQGLSYEEIAEQLGKTEKSIDNALQRIRGKLSRK
jgi:RNA polymerase sporulation-specific sigma factor